MHFLERSITLDATSDQLWSFLATPANLNELTPPQLQFKILSALPDQMYNGLTILYAIKIPLSGSPSGCSAFWSINCGWKRCWSRYLIIGPNG